MGSFFCLATRTRRLMNKLKEVPYMAVWQVIVYLIIYVTVGIGVFLVLDQWNLKLRTNLYNKTERIEAYQKYNRLTTWSPKTINIWTKLIAIVLGIVIWMLWPIASIGSAIWYELTYRKLLKKYST